MRRYKRIIAAMLAAGMLLSSTPAGNITLAEFPVDMEGTILAEQDEQYPDDTDVMQQEADDREFTIASGFLADGMEQAIIEEDAVESVLEFSSPSGDIRESQNNIEDVIRQAEEYDPMETDESEKPEPNDGLMTDDAAEIIQDHRQNDLSLSSDDRDDMELQDGLHIIIPETDTAVDDSEPISSETETLDFGTESPETVELFETDGGSSASDVTEGNSDGEAESEEMASEDSVTEQRAGEKESEEPDIENAVTEKSALEWETVQEESEELHSEKINPEKSVPESTTKEIDTETSAAEINGIETFDADETDADDTDTEISSTEDMGTEVAVEEVYTEGIETENLQAMPMNLAAAQDQCLWNFDYYYVNENDLHDVTKTADLFNLKAQIEFHTSQTLEAGAVVIIVPQKLLTQRAGSERIDILPDDISLSQADTEGIQVLDDPYETVRALLSDQEKQRWTASSGLHFNYYVDGEGNLVFFNYEEITSGTNVTWQILYKRLRQLDIVDGTSWALEACAQVKPSGEGTVQEQRAVITGRTDSAVTLSSVEKFPAEIQMQQYAPGLYTRSQVEKYISTFSSEEWKRRITEGSTFADYKYVLWDVSVKGSGNQPWNLSIQDMPSYKVNNEVRRGEVVGFIDNSKDGGSSEFSKVYVSGYGNDCWRVRSMNVNDRLDVRFYVVTAYPSTVQEGELLTNDLTAILEPADLQDAMQTKTAHAEWSYKDYHWLYRGDIIGIDKYNRYVGTHEQSYYGWLKRYEAYRKDGKDAGELPFETRGECYGYSFTHGLFPSDPDTYGQYLNGSYYRITCVDDAVYAFCGDQEVLLTDEDYYFDEVEFIREDYGYDIWEDQSAAAEHPDDLDQTMTVFAMFEGTETWEPIGMAAFDTDDTSSYQFTDEQIARHPYRVKAEYNACSYHTECLIRISVCLKQDSPVLSSMLYEGEERNGAASLQIENLSGIAGQAYGAAGIPDGTYFQDTRTDGDNGHGGTNYSEPGIEAFTEQLYGTILMRDCAIKLFTDLHSYAAAAKTGVITNDPSHRRGLIQYELTQLDGYNLYSEGMIPYLKKLGVPSPGMKEVVWYDLLPAGMTFDASGPISAGRITKLKADRRTWDASQTKVTVDPDTDVIPNWRNTGRTMVVLHISYEGVDPARYIDGLWAQGWGVSFRAYYSWDSLTAADNPVNTNIAAFMPDGEAAKTAELCGGIGEVYKDDGQVPNTGGYKGFFDSGDLNDDGVTDVANVQYAETWVAEDIAIGAKDSIEKKVRADKDISAPYGTSTYTLPGGTYTYAVTVSSASGLKDLVIFDRLEHALQDRAEVPNETFAMDETSWYGTFVSVDTGEAQLMGIHPVVYYHADRDAKTFIPSSLHVPEDVDQLLASAGWMTEAEWLSSGRKVEDVKAIAVDLRSGENGSYELKKGESVSIYIHMAAPEETDAVWAYNNPSYFSTRLSATDAETTAFVVGNSVRVALGRKSKLEVLKRCEGEIPEMRRDEEFSFRISRNGTPLANQIYALQKEDGSSIENSPVYATDTDGRFTLQSGQKAVFTDLPVLSAEEYQVEEEESPFWKSSINTSESDDGIKKEFINTFRPVVYVRKNLAGIPENENPGGEEFDSTKAVFTFRVLDENGAGMGNLEYWYVKTARTDGTVPEKDIDKGTAGVGKTGADGSFQITGQDIIALMLDHIGQKYSIEEVTEALSEEGSLFIVNDGMDDNWVVRDPVVEGTTVAEGTSAVITNFYRWKNLDLYKEILHRSETAARTDTTEFTFRLLHADGSPAAGKRYSMEQEDGLTPIAGETGEDGSFTAPCAGRTVHIMGLEAGKTYIVQETSAGEGTDYVMVNDGKVTAVMPLYSGRKKVTLTNAWTKRPLYIQKTVVTDLKELQNRAAAEQFSFTVKIDGSAYADRAFTVIRNGKPVIGGAEPIELTSPGWPDAYPGGLGDANSSQQAIFPGASFIRVTFDPASEITENRDWIHLRSGDSETGFSRRISGSNIGGTSYIVPGDTAVLSLITAGSGVGFSARLVPLDSSGRVLSASNSVVDSARSFRTDENGMLQLQSGETACFADVGQNGMTVYEVMEIHEEGELFTQIFPADNESAAGTLSGSSTTAQFINGTAGVILLSKNLTAGALDHNALGERAVEAELAGAVQEQNRHIYQPVHFILEYWSDEKWKRFSKTDFAQMGVSVVYSDGSLKKVTSYAARQSMFEGNQLLVEAGCTYLLSGSLPHGSNRLRVTEAAEDQQRVFWFDNGSQSGYIHAGILSPADGSVVLDNVAENPAAVITNELEGLPEGSVIYKKLRSLALPEDGIPLTLQLERYDGVSWEPADDVEYFEKYDEQKTGTWHKTDASGSVTMELLDGEIPALVFPYEEVKINPSSVQKGALRIRESAGLQNGWGCLQGYALSTAEDAESVSLGLQDADTFVNDSREAQIRIGKYLQGEEEGKKSPEFRFRIDQIIKSSAEVSFDQMTAKDILETAGSRGIQYEVYDDAEMKGKPIYAGSVEADGTLNLAAGQFAVLHVTQGSLWRVQEVQNVPGFRLAEISGRQSTTTKVLGGNVVLLRAEDVPLVTLHYNDDTSRITRLEVEDMSELPEAEELNVVKNGYEFAGWYTDPSCEHSAPASGAVTKDITLYGGWVKNYSVRYAVQLYGIRHDTGMDGSPLGLTFGPARGKSLIRSSRSHTPSAGKLCIHDLSWQQIIEQSAKNPTVFSECLEQECTHSVNLRVNAALIGTDYWGSMSGDGASVLRYSILLQRRRYNAVNTNMGGWPASYIRSMMNGTDSYTKTEAAGDTLISSAETLLSCFPRELREGIAPKAVKSDTIWDSKIDGNVTTYDKLWLPSAVEMFTDSDEDVRLNEGTTYELIQRKGITTQDNSNGKVYEERGQSSSFWLRSIGSGTANSAWAAAGVGGIAENLVTTASGITPFFCLR